MNSKISGKIVFKDQLRYFVFDKKKGFLIYVISAMILASMFFFLEILPLFYSILYIFILPVAALLFMFSLALILMKKTHENSDQQIHERVVLVNEQGIEYGASGNQILFHWSDIQKSVFLEKLIILHISANQALIIPTRFFSSVEEEEKWITFIKKHLSI